MLVSYDSKGNTEIASGKQTWKAYNIINICTIRFVRFSERSLLKTAIVNWLTQHSTNFRNFKTDVTNIMFLFSVFSLSLSLSLSLSVCVC